MLEQAHVFVDQLAKLLELVGVAIILAAHLAFVRLGWLRIKGS